jgi:hypothetical protein
MFFDNFVQEVDSA